MASTSRVPVDAHGRDGKIDLKGKGKEVPLEPDKHVLDAPMNYKETVQLLTEFIEVMVHSILCIRRIYPQEVFIRRKRFSAPVWQARHPGLCEYISNAAKAIKAQMLRRCVHNAVLLVTGQKNLEPLERFVFRLSYVLPTPEPRDRDINISDQLTQYEAELYLRGMVEKVMALEGKLAPYPDPEDVTFTLVIEVKEGMQPKSYDKNEPPEGPWVPLDQNSIKNAHSAQSEREEDRNRSYTLPIKTLQTGVINMVFYAEEHVTNKGDRDIAPLPSRTPGSSRSVRMQPGSTQKSGKEAISSTAGAAGPSEPSGSMAARAGRGAPAARVWRESERDLDEPSRDSPTELYADSKIRKGKRRKGGQVGGIGAAMGSRTGGGVVNAADIGDGDEDDDGEIDTPSDSNASHSPAGSGNEMTSVAGIGFGGPARLRQERGW